MKNNTYTKQLIKDEDDNLRSMMIPNIKYDDTQYDSYNIFHKLKTENSNYPPDPSCRNLLPPKYVRIPIDIKNDLFPYYMISPDLGINSYFHELGTNENILSYPNKSKISHLSMYPKVPIKTIKDEEYVYVNSIQYKRILSRREKRKKLNIVPRRYPPNEKRYIHESRHKHAMTRERGKGGRFIGKDNKCDNVKVEEESKDYTE